MFLAKFIFKLHMHGSDRAVVIKIPLVREVMPKGGLAAFLRSRDERRLTHRRTLSSRRSASGSSPSHRSAIGDSQREQVEETTDTAGNMRSRVVSQEYCLTTYQEEQEGGEYAASSSLSRSAIGDSQKEQVEETAGTAGDTRPRVVSQEYCLSLYQEEQEGEAYMPKVNNFTS